MSGLPPTSSALNTPKLIGKAKQMLSGNYDHQVEIGVPEDLNWYLCATTQSLLRLQIFQRRN